MTGEILYIHGFASSPNSRKAQMLDEFFKNLGLNIVLRPQMPVSPLKAIDFLCELYKYNPVKIIVGSSLGGFYALYMHQRFGKRTVLINPALKPSESLGEAIGLIKRHNTDEFFHWTAEHVEQLRELESHLDISKLDQSKLHFYLSEDDEVLDHSQIPKLFPYAQIKFYKNSKHAFEKFDKILPEILSLYTLESQ